MKVLKFFRQPYFAFILASIILFVSCKRDNLVTEKSIDAKELSKIHQTSLINFKNSKEVFENRTSTYDFDEKYVETEYLNNLKYLNKNGIEALLIKNNIDTEVLSEFDFFLANENNPDVYLELENDFTFETVEEAQFLFNLVVIYNAVEKELNLEKNMNLTKSQLYRISWGCALAIAGTITVTVGAIWVSGGSALLYWIFSKGLATAALIEACGDGWGDI